MDRFRLCCRGFSCHLYRDVLHRQLGAGPPGKQQSEDENTGGRQLSDKPKEVARQMKRDGMASDIKIGDLPILKNSEIQNFCLHGTVGSGKSEVIRRLLNYVRARGDMAIIYDRSCEFVKSYYDPSLDKILNPLDSRCAAPGFVERVPDAAGLRQHLQHPYPDGYQRRPVLAGFRSHYLCRRRVPDA